VGHSVCIENFTHFTELGALLRQLNIWSTSSWIIQEKPNAYAHYYIAQQRFYFLLHHKGHCPCGFPFFIKHYLFSNSILMASNSAKTIWVYIGVLL
jgi:hypothetical protein